MEDDEVDIDEQQDWRFVNEKNQLPKRGEKDFEPDGTGVQDSTLQDSRCAMYDALRSERKHASKNHISATWFEDKKLARVDVMSGPHFGTIGRSDSRGVQWLNSEETIYLLERGSMVLLRPDGLLMSLQAAYAACFQTLHDLERYQVYSYLKKIGFAVLSAKPPSTDTSSHGSFKFPRVGLTWIKLFRWSASSDVLAKRQCYRSYSQIYKELDIIGSTKPEIPAVNTVLREDVLSVTFDIWKPNAQFRKSDPPRADYRIVVLSTRDSVMPSLNDISALLQREPSNVSAAKSRNARLKEGKCNVILAIVDAGIISFLKVSDVDFSTEYLYEEKRPNNKTAWNQKARKA